MATTQAEYDATLQARNTGSLIVRHGETSVTYRSLDEMERILAAMRQELGIEAPERTTPRVRYIWQKSRGY